MASNKDLTEFPDVEAKLQKPSKQSAFEKQKADAEAKRRREAAETAAVYESFVKSFDNEDDDVNSANFASRGNRGLQHQHGAPLGRPAAFGGGASRRHFGAGSGTGMKSGPGSLGPPPTAFGKKRGFDSYQQGHRDTSRGRLGFHDDENEGSHSVPLKLVAKVFDTSDDENDARARDLAEEKAIAKPTLRLANLPPGASPAFVKALIPTNLTVENVKIISAGSSTGSERKSMAAIVTLSKETPATDIDTTVSSLQNKYLGYGFYLSLHRHLSSAVASTTITSSLTSSTTTSHAFGAKPVPQTADSNPYQYGGHRGFAPPTSYSLSGGPLQKTILHVPVSPPKDIKQLQLIHKVIEAVLEHGPEFEALLMSRPDVQKEEKWAWLWDARSEGGVWYRWRLWEIITGAPAKVARQGKYLPLFEGSHAWKMPDKGLAYEYTTAIDEFVSDPEYNSSDEEDYEDEPQKPAEAGENENIYLNPLDKAKLAHLLARLPTTLTRIRKGDIARVTAFAITHASRGSDEIVDMIVSNIARPFALTSANPEYRRSDKTSGTHDGESHNSTPMPDEATKSNEVQDTSGASLVGLYVVSDILSSSATSTVRHAWRYRQLFDASLKQRKIFEILGLMPERRGWGRLRGEKWKRSVGLVLSLWEGWCAFPQESQQFFTQTFESPPSAKKEEQAEEGLKKSKWKKTVEAGSAAQQNSDRGFKPVSAVTSAEYDPPEDGEPTDDVDGEAMDDEMMDLELDSDVDGVPMDEDDATGEPMDEDRDDPGSEATGGQGKNTGDEPENGGRRKGPTTQEPRRRLRAVDMFADSDGSDGDK
ncbi:hypothetical protein DL765_009069 [Monosporascus sp. GIB2]|nr:hypothetical protein DL765_009069 [Monosporascus sp. GIB2]